MHASDRPVERSIEIGMGGLRLSADLVLPRMAHGVVLFAHGSGSSRTSPRNRAVAATLQEAGFATLLLDLLSTEEDAREQAGGMLRFDVERLSGRVGGALDWLIRESSTHDLPIGIFGSSTSAASALMIAARRPAEVRCVVSRGGRPDLASDALELVSCPTLLIVGSADEVVLDLNRTAFARLHCFKELAIVPGATHLFEERGALEKVAGLARDWFARHLASQAHVG